MQIGWSLHAGNKVGANGVASALKRCPHSLLLVDRVVNTAALVRSCRPPPELLRLESPVPALGRPVKVLD